MWRKDNMKSIESKMVPAKSASPQSPETQEKIKKYMDWMDKEHKEIESSDFGSNRVGVEKAKAFTKTIGNDVKKQSSEIKEFLQNQDSRIPEVREANLVFETLNALIDKQSACLDVISEIAALEEGVQNLSLNFDTTAVHLMNSGARENAGSELTNIMSHQNLVKSSQKCNLAVRKNWQWVGTLLHCTQVHFNNASTFHQFFHDAQEAEYWMKNTLANIHMTFDRSKLQGDMVDVQSMKDEMKDILCAYIQWQGKIDSLFDRAKTVFPVPRRILPNQEPQQAKALTDYRTDEFEVTEDECITLLDNSNKTSWKVKNSRGQEGMVPAVVVLIPGPNPNAIDIAIKLRIQLLALWTASIKRLGYKVIAFMLLVIKDYNEEEIVKLSQMTESQRKELLLVLKFIEDAMVEYWNGYDDFEELQERMHRIRLIFEENPNSEDGSEERFSSSVVVQVGALKDLLGKYKDFWAYWETYKVIVELIKQPKFVLICDKWEQLRFVTTAHFVRFWDTQLDVKTVGEIDEIDKIEKIDQVVAEKCLAIHETPKESMGSSQLTVATEHEETETEQVETFVEEEERTFFMKDVQDPRDDSVISFQHAVMLGIVDQTNNRYINPDTGNSIPLRDAINAGKISLEWTSRKKIREEKKSYGLITIKTTRETRPYTIMEVVDPKTGKPIPVAEAMDQGILDTHNSIYKGKDGEDMPLTEAIDLKKVIVDYHGDKNAKPETVTKTYAVSAVVDQKKKDKIPFAEAISCGILDKEHGFYLNNVTGKKFNLGEAIMKGFIKARVVTDVSKLDINPENKIVVERIQNVRDKLMRGIKAINAMKGLKK